MNLRIVSKIKDGHYRAGRHWPSTAVVVDPTKFTEEQLKQLLDDPNLVITVAEEGGISADKLDEESITLAEALANTTAERDAALKAVDDYKRQLDKANSAIAELKADSAKAVASVVEAGKEIDALKTQLEKANSDLEAAKGKKGGK